MTKTRVILVAIATFIAGVVGGGYLTMHFMANMMDSYSISNESAGVGTHVLALKLVREGNNAQAIELLENLLDGDLIGLAARDPSTLPESALRSLRQASEYRTKYSRVSKNAEVEAAVQRALKVGRGRGS